MRIFDRRRVEALCGPTTVYHIVSEILPWVFFLITVIVLAASWSRIPDMIPMHSDGRGNVTDWSGKGSLIWLCAVYMGINLLLLIIGFFPQTWNSTIRIRSFGRGAGGQNYRRTRDLLADMRISMSLLFSAMLMLSAFYHPVAFKIMLSFGIWLLIGIPMLRYIVGLLIDRSRGR